MDDIGNMKKAGVLKIACIVLCIGMFFAGCTFKAELESRLISGHASESGAQSDGGYATVLK